MSGGTSDILRQIAQIEEPTAPRTARALKQDLRRVKSHLSAFEMIFVANRLPPITESTCHPLYFHCDVGIARYFEADFSRLLHTWLVQEAFAAKEWSDNIKETLGFCRSSKGAVTHLVNKRSRSEWEAIKVIAKERFSSKDTLSLEAVAKVAPNDAVVQLSVLGSTAATYGRVVSRPWESLVQ